MAILRYFNTVVRSHVSVSLIYIDLAATTKMSFNKVERSALDDSMEPSEKTRYTPAIADLYPAIVLKAKGLSLCRTVRKPLRNSAA